MNEREYQLQVKNKLASLYSEVEVQWYPFRGAGRKIYSPVVDVAVGPFAITHGFENEYGRMLDETRDFIESLIHKHNENMDTGESTSFNNIFGFNSNARCFLCIEIENSKGRKHCFGNLLNASALGRIGILVARTETVLGIFLRQRVYLEQLDKYGKNTFKTDNALVLSEAQFNDCLQ